MNEVISLNKKVRVTTEIPVTVYIFPKEQLVSFIETDRISTAFVWLSNIALDVAIGAWFSLKQIGLDIQTNILLQSVFWTALTLTPIFGTVAAWFAWKHYKIQKGLASQQT